MDAAIVALVPILVAWLLVYIVVCAVRWIRAWSPTVLNEQSRDRPRCRNLRVNSQARIIG
jgi:hypothetical protein